MTPTSRQTLRVIAIGMFVVAVILLPYDTGIGVMFLVLGFGLQHEAARSPRTPRKSKSRAKNH